LSITSTVLLFVLLPTAVVVVVSALALAGGGGRRARRYRPGRPYDFTPIWFLASPGQVTGSAGSVEHVAGIGSSAVAGEVTGSGIPALGGSDTGTDVSSRGGHAQPPAMQSGAVESGARVPMGATGGASDRW
jgi:hypothetical protein